MDIETIRRDWHDRGFSCDLWTDPLCQRWESYAHPIDELVMIIEGDVEFEIESTCHRPTQGKELFTRRALILFKPATLTEHARDGWSKDRSQTSANDYAAHVATSKGKQENPAPIATREFADHA